MDEFEKLLEQTRLPVERFVRFRVSISEDADDLLQEVYLTAYQKFNDGQMTDYIPTDEDLARGFAGLPWVPGQD